MPELLYFDRDLVVLVKPVGLVSEDGGGERRVLSGDVSVRGLMGYC